MWALGLQWAMEKLTMLNCSQPQQVPCSCHRCLRHPPPPKPFLVFISYYYFVTKQVKWQEENLPARVLGRWLPLFKPSIQTRGLISSVRFSGVRTEAQLLSTRPGWRHRAGSLGTHSPARCSGNGHLTPVFFFFFPPIVLTKAIIIYRIPR